MFVPLHGVLLDTFFCSVPGRKALDVVSKMLTYDPLKRIKPLEVCSHEFVDEV